MAVITPNGIITKPAVENNNKLDKASTMLVGEFFANKNIFITGGTGFLGTVLIEALLGAHPDIGTIYVLVRGKRKLNPHDRITRLLQKPIFKKYEKTTLQKVVPIVGELSEPNFGFKDNVLQELGEKVNVIYHIAATIKFSSPLRTAIRTNLSGTMRTIEFAKKLKNLSAYVYCSTAFCNSNNRGMIYEDVYKSIFDPYEMMQMAEDDQVWEDFTDAKCKEIIGDHPNTYTFTKNLAENLIISEMTKMPAAIVRPSIVYGTWEHPMQGWVGNANSGHLGYLAGYIKGMFRTMCGKAESVIDIIPCDYVISSMLVMGWYVGTREVHVPEVIHCTSGEVNPLTLQEFCKIVNAGVKRHPPDNFVWKPKTKLRNGWRYNLFFYLFHILPALVFHIPEKILPIGMPQHTTLEYMKVFYKGTKAFDFFLDKDFQYSQKKSLRILSQLSEKDKKRYNFDATHCNWTEFLEGCLIGVRHFYFKESLVTTTWHRVYWAVFDVLYYLGFVAIFAGLFTLFYSIFGLYIGAPLAILVWGFIVWL